MKNRRFARMATSHSERKYPQTRWEAKIHDLSTFQPDYDDKEIYTCKVDLFIYKDDDGDEIF